MNSTKGGSESQQEISRAEQGGLEGWGSGRSAGDPCFCCATLINNWENLQLQTPKPGHEDLEESELPDEW